MSRHVSTLSKVLYTSICRRPEFHSQLLEQIFQNFQIAVSKTTHTKMKQIDTPLGATQKSYAPLKAYLSVQFNIQETHFFSIKIDCINSFKIGCLQNFVSQPELQKL